MIYSAKIKIMNKKLKKLKVKRNITKSNFKNSKKVRRNLVIVYKVRQINKVT